MRMLNGCPVIQDSQTHQSLLSLKLVTDSAHSTRPSVVSSIALGCLLCVLVMMKTLQWKFTLTKPRTDLMTSRLLERSRDRMTGSSCGALPCSCGTNSYKRRAKAMTLALIICGDAPTRPPKIMVNRVWRPPLDSSSPPSANCDRAQLLHKQWLQKTYACLEHVDRLPSLYSVSDCGQVLECSDFFCIYRIREIWNPNSP